MPLTPVIDEHNVERVTQIGDFSGTGRLKYDLVLTVGVAEFSGTNSSGRKVAPFSAILIELLDPNDGKRLQLDLMPKMAKIIGQRMVGMSEMLLSDDKK